MSRSFQVTYDAADPVALAEFWALALGYELQPPPPGFDDWDSFADEIGLAPEERNVAAVVDPAGNGPRLYFQQVPEGKTSKNRVHLDVKASDREADVATRRQQVEDHVDRLLGAGATRVTVFERELKGYTEYWVVMQDPEGNEFCVE